MNAEKNKRNKKSGVLICGAYGHGNAGDEAILEAIVGQMRAIDPEMPITVLSRRPEETAAKLGVNALYTFDVFGFLRVMRRIRLYINGGGSLIQDATSRRSLLYYLYTLRAAKKRGARVIMYGCGIGPVSRRGDTALTRRVLNRYVDVITLREPDSIAELERFGVRGPEIRLSADPAMTLPAAAPQAVEAKMRELGLEPEGRYVCFCLRRWPGFEARAACFASAADMVCEEFGLTPVFLSINHRSDGEAADSAAALMKNRPVILREPLETGLTIGIMSRMRAVCSMRLHGLIFAAGSGTPLVGVSYDPKVTAFLRSAGNSACLEFDRLDAGELCAELRAALSGDTRASLREQAEKLAKLAAVNVECAKRLLEE